MKAGNALGVFVIGVLVGVWVLREPTDNMGRRLAEQSAENERLRLFNAREVRRYKHPNAIVDAEACAVASHILGTPPSVIAAIWEQENGPPDIETGVLGKTDHFSKHFPIKQWPALEAARTMNIYVYRWLLETKEGNIAWKKILKRTAVPYTKDTKAEEWSSNVYLLERRARQ